MDKYVIKKKLGNGMIGTVYLATHNSKSYALKIEHILPKDLQYSTRSDVWREIEFCEKFASKYPRHFIQLKKWEIIESCDHKQKYAVDLKVFPIKLQKHFEKLAQSPYCIMKVYTLVSTSLNKVISKLTSDQLYSIYIQLIHIVQLMRKHGWIHGDLHPGNVGLVKTKQKTLKIGDSVIPTHGYFCQLIDFGLVMHKSMIKTTQDKSKYNTAIKYEIPSLKWWLIKTSVWDHAERGEFKIVQFPDHYRLFKKSPYFKPISLISNDKFSQMFLFHILHNEMFQLTLTHNKRHFPMKLLIPAEDAIAFVLMEDKLPDLIQYLINKLK